SMKVDVFSPEDIRAKAYFDEHGFAILEPQFRQEECVDALRALDVLLDGYAQDQGLERERYVESISQWRDLWRADPSGTFDRLLRDARLWSTAAQFLGQKGARLLHDHVIMKPVQSSDTVPWHQDYPYWPVSPAEGLSCWCPLEDVGPNGGCLEVIDGSHHFGESPPEDFLAHGRAEFDLRDDLVRLPARAGSIVVLHSLTWHRTGPNLDAGRRPAYISLWLPADARYAPDHSGWHPVNEHVSVAPGEILNDDWFPRFGGLVVRDCVQVSPLSAKSTETANDELSMFTASTTIATQLRTILVRAGAVAPAGGVGVLLALDGATEMIVRETLKAGLCSQVESNAIERALQNLRIAADAYRLHRARNVYNGAYGEWWRIAGKAWSALLRTEAQRVTNP
ncbi:MAG TPA: phytanoyl-CoA dioxygenase family protein, partial [Polyangium sp.]|nr:phytanoyl-CoA dioxygenase family protein [Polyangium sp.]